MEGNAEGLKSTAFHALSARLPRVEKKVDGGVGGMVKRGTSLTMPCLAVRCKWTGDAHRRACAFFNKSRGAC
jgi:hypothetical protein